MVVASSFEQHRALLWRLCYRMTGSAADADDLVQDTFERALTHPPDDLERDLKPWLVRVALNLSRDALRRRKHQDYVGPWLPSPIETEDFEPEARPDARYGELESVSMAFLVALEALTPTQRGVVLLCDVLGYSVKEAAHALAVSESNVKTTHHRARAALAGYDATRVPLTRGLQEETRTALAKLMLGMLTGDVAALEAQLSEDVRAVNDGAGEYYAARVPVLGRDRVIKFHLKLRRPEAPRVAMRDINGLPALVGEYAHTGPGLAPRFVLFIGLDAQGRVREMNTTVASRKLSHVRFG